MAFVDDIGLVEFLRDNPSMALRPSTGKDLRLKGRFQLTADHQIGGPVEDSFELEILVPPAFPRALPRVLEVAGRIPRHGAFHTNGDGSLCLGSYVRLLLKVSAEPTLVGFTSRCLVPYLYAISLKLRNGGELVFGELAHNGPGMLEDYAQIFELPTPGRAQYALELLAKKKRLANKCTCPCGCNTRLGRCRFRFRLRKLRKLASRAWFRDQLQFC